MFVPYSNYFNTFASMYRLAIGYFDITTEANLTNNTKAIFLNTR